MRAEWLGGLRVRATNRDGHTVEADMPGEIGGTGERMTPGTLLRSALAACDATRIAMAAAQPGIELSRLGVEVTSTSDQRGLLGLGGVEPGPIEVGMRYRLASETASEDELRALADEAERCSPVLSALRREIPVSVELELG
ncbi:MAG TPA: OsmC family protein [Actinomycetes bacterium]|nr:OsmC family protein [Actinomycetes bacterium]